MNRKPKIGEKVWVRKICKNKPCTIKEIKWIYIYVRPFHAKENVEVTIDDIEYIQPEMLTGEEKYTIVNKLVKSEMFKENISNFNMEIATLNFLIKKYPNLEFWRQFDPGFQVKSLKWWIGSGMMQMNNFYNLFELDFEQKKTTIGDKKLGEDIKIEKQQTFKELLT